MPPPIISPGELDTDPEISFLSPKAYFKHPDITEIQNALFLEKKTDARPE